MKSVTSIISLTALALVVPFCFSSAEVVEQTPLQTYPDASTTPKRVAIIGAGAGGTSTAYHLSKFVSESYSASTVLPNITIFEQSPYIGGRSTIVHAYGLADEPVELGASIFVSINHILVSVAQDLGLHLNGINEARSQPAEDEDPGDDTADRSLGIWDSEKFVFTQTRSSGWGSWWNMAKLFWRYGYAPVRTQKLMKETVGKFMNLYSSHFPFEDLSIAAYDLGLAGTLASTGEQFLKERGVSNMFSREIIQASTRVNYGQNLGLLHGLEAMVCMATEGATSVEGGNYQIFEGMAKMSGANVKLNTSVTALSRLESGGYKVSFGTLEEEEFDTVVLASPYHLSNITVTPSPAYKPTPIAYVTLYVTLFTSPHKISPLAFGLDASATAAVPEMLLTTLPNGVNPGINPGDDIVGPAGFFSISMLRRLVNPHTHETEQLYKIFSAQPLNASFVAGLLGIDVPRVASDKSEGEGGIADLSPKDVTWYYEKKWLAYPFLYPRVSFDRSLLDDDEDGEASLWYTSGIESFISTMETSALMGMNVARLIVDRWSASA